MTTTEFDLFVIGGGSGGVRAARWSAALGARVAICESDRFGGTCVIRGCIPKKLMVYASHFHEDFQTAREYGWQVGKPTFDWQTFKTKRDQEASRLSNLYKGILEKNAVTHIQGHGKIIAPNQVEVHDKVYHAKKILITTGSTPSIPDIKGIQHSITSDGIFLLDQQPKQIAVIGSGYIGLEFACILAGLGSEVHVFIRSDRILRDFDKEITEFLINEMQKKGIQMHFQTRLVEIIKKDSELTLTDDKGQTYQTQCVLNATGRHPLTQNLGLTSVDIRTKENGAIIVNDSYQTNVKSIYALGDCTDRMNLTPVATAEGTWLAETLFGPHNPTRINYDFIPSSVFTQPPLASVGYSEEIASQKGLEFDVYTSEFRSLKFTITGIQERFFIKVIVEKGSNRVIGAHCVGMDSPEIMQGIAIAVRAGLTKQDFDATIGIHPTIAEEFCTLRNKRES